MTITPNRQPGEMTPHYAVHWEAQGGGLYPVFDGRLVVEGDNDYDTLWLAIDGSYDPPAGVAGKVFDTIIGHRIASSATHNLLLTIRDVIHVFFEEEECAKKWQRSKENAGVLNHGNCSTL